MRRLIGLVVLAALIFGAWWLVQNGYDMVRFTGDMTVSEDATPAAEGEQAAEAPAESAEAPAAPEAGAAAPAESAAAPAAPPAASSAASGAPAAETPDSTAAAPEAPAGAEPPAAESTAEAPAAETPAPAAGDVPTFDIVRVEPSGDTVIAGLAAPNTKVEVLDGPEAVATAEANERGEWALVLDKPLPPGTHDLAIRTTSKDQSTVTLSDQRVAVAVPEDKNEEPLVVLSAPDAPSSVMQAPEAAPKESEIASAPSAGEGAPSAGEPVTPPAAAAPAAPGETASAPEATPAEPSTLPASSPESETAGAAPGEPATPPAAPAEPSSSPAQAPGESETAAAPPAESAAPPAAEAPAAAGPQEPAAPVPPPESSVATAEPPAATEGAGTSPEAQPGTGAPAAAAGSEAAPPATAETPASPPPAAPAPPAPEVGVAAVEAETDGSLYVAGTATTKDPVRVYLDDQLIGEAEPTEGGTWLLETKREVMPGDYTIRADQVETGSGKVIVRAEVPFEREVEVAVLKPSGESGDAGSAEASGSIAGPMTVIIKRGDNLWRISRELYGRGVRYSTIYQANRDQIRNPNRIYPGQVFVLPAGDTTWQN